MIGTGNYSGKKEQRVNGTCRAGGSAPSHYSFDIDESQARGPPALVRLSKTAGLI